MALFLMTRLDLKPFVYVTHSSASLCHTEGAGVCGWDRRPDLIHAWWGRQVQTQTWGPWCRATGSSLHRCPSWQRSAYHHAAQRVMVVAVAVWQEPAPPTGMDTGDPSVDQVEETHSLCVIVSWGCWSRVLETRWLTATAGYHPSVPGSRSV